MNRENEIKVQVAEVMRRNADRLRGHTVFLFGSRASGSARLHFSTSYENSMPLQNKIYIAGHRQSDPLAPFRGRAGARG
jgi:hypothetical protein